MNAIPQPIAENSPTSHAAPQQALPVAAQMIFEHDARGTILEATEACGRLFGCSPYNLEGLRLTDLVPAREHPKLLEALGKVFRSGEASIMLDLRREARAPIARLEIERAGTGFRTRLRPSLKPQRQPVPAPKAEPELAPDELANVSHEIRTPLNAVIGFADALRQESFGPLGDKRYRDYARLIQESGQHVLALVNDLLDLSKADAEKLTIEREPVRVDHLILSCAELLRPQVEEAGLRLHCQIAPSVGIHVVDPKVLRQILLNLLSNALKFTKAGGLILRARVMSGNLVVAVEDTGVGMSKEELARIGERFFQARREGVRGAKGSGLGLALSSALAKAHDGRLDLMSEPGRGTVATLTIPATIERKQPTYRPLENKDPRPQLRLSA